MSIEEQYLLALDRMTTTERFARGMQIFDWTREVLARRIRAGSEETA